MDAATWSAAVESGWTALPIPEDAGGLGAGAAELCVLAEELGRGLLVGRFLVGDVLAGQLLAAAPAGARRDALLEALVAGSREHAVADAEPVARGAPGALRLQARRTAAGWELDGAKSLAWVACRRPGIAGDRRGRGSACGRGAGESYGYSARSRRRSAAVRGTTRGAGTHLPRIPHGRRRTRARCQVCSGRARRCGAARRGRAVASPPRAYAPGTWCCSPKPPNASG